MLKYLIIPLVVALASPAFAITKEEALQAKQEKIERAEAYNESVTGGTAVESAPATPSKSHTSSRSHERDKKDSATSTTVNSGNTTVTKDTKTEDGVKTNHVTVTVGGKTIVDHTTTKPVKHRRHKHGHKPQLSNEPFVGWNEWHQNRQRDFLKQQAKQDHGAWNWHD